MKRIGAVLLSALLLLTTFPTFAVSAEVTEPSIVVGVPEEGVHAGDTFTVTVNTVNNPGIVSVALKVGYDADVLELVSIKGQDFAGTSFGPLTANPIAVNWYDALSPNNTTDGVLAELTFTVKEDAAAGDTAITLTYNPDNIYDFDFNNVTFAMVEGVVSIHRHDAVCEHVYDNACDAECNECGETRIPTDHVYTNACDATCNVCGDTREVGDHLYEHACDTTCNECGAVREITHTYDNACDADCNVCGETREVGDHVYDDDLDADCNECGAVREITHVYDNACDATCNVCGDTRIPADHKGGVATCRDKAVCAVCGAEYGEFNPNNHVGGEVTKGQCPATCAAEGYTGDIHCGGCDVILAQGEAIAKLPHTYDNACDADCNVCGETREVGDHVYDDDLDADCNECGAVREITHTYDNACDADCNACGETRIPADHVYDDLRDLDCNECGGARKINAFKFTAPATRVYTKGATLDLTGGWIDIAYADGASGRLELTADMVRGFDPDNTTAVQTVTVSFGGKTATYKVRVMEGDELPTFVVDSLDAYKTNGTFDVTVRLENNPGIVSMVLDVDYDTDALELVSIKGQDYAGTSFGPLTANPIAVNWCDALNPNNTTDGVVAVLTFRIKDDAPEGPVAITVSYDQANVYDYDFEDVPFNVTDGVVTIFDYMRGDLNGDCIVDNKDLGLMMQYLNRWNVEIDVRALDVYADGIIDNKDYGLLQRYLNRWDVELG